MNHYWALGFLCPVEVHIPSDWYAKWQSIGGNWLYLYQQVSTANSFFVGMGLCFYFFVSMLGPSLSWTSPSFVHSYCHSLCEVLCALVSLFPEGTISLGSSITSGSSNLSVSSVYFPEPIGEAFDEDILFRTEYSTVLQFLCMLYCVNSYLLRERFTLIKDEEGTELGF